MQKFLVFGGGRMGLSHASMIGLLDLGATVVIVEPDLKTRWLTRLITGHKFRVVKNFASQDVRFFSHAVIATPPPIHQENVDFLLKCGFSGKLLIEKPIMVSSDSLEQLPHVMSGYVIRHAYLWKRLKQELAAATIHEVIINLETNQDFRAQGQGWRSDDLIEGRSLLYEFGSHCINLMLDLVCLQRFKIIARSANEIKLECKDNSSLKINLFANSSRVRKSVYSVEVDSSSGSYTTDFYTLRKVLPSMETDWTMSLASEGVASAAYLRGQEFASQCEALITDFRQGTRDIEDAIKTDNLLSQIEEDMK